MKETFHFCDRCKRQETFMRTIQIDAVYRSFLGDGCITVELCRRCQKDFKVFMKDKKDNKGVQDK
ncbi:MAG TPA: hypothetical protein VIR31_04480 [Nitrososphaeraceae archaeon]